MSSKSKVLAVGVFDIFHYGHLSHLCEARMHGDELIVGVTRDEFVNKGPRRPVFDIYKRMAILRSLAMVDRVVVVDGSLDALRLIRPDVFVLGREYDGNVKHEDAAFCKENGIKIIFTQGPVFSSTELLHHYDRARQR